MPKKREIKVVLTRPLKLNKAAIKLIAEDFLDWYEKRERERREQERVVSSNDSSEKIKESE